MPNFQNLKIGRFYLKNGAFYGFLNLAQFFGKIAPTFKFLFKGRHYKKCAILGECKNVAEFYNF